MKYDPIPVTPSVVTWARHNAGFSIDEAKKTFRAIEAWESGDSMPTYPQVEQMSDKFKVPVAVFFFPEPPDLHSISESFRTIPEHEFETLPPKVRLLVRKAKAFQLSLCELLGDVNPSKRLLTRDLSFGVNTSIADMAAEVRSYLKISVNEQKSWKKAATAVEKWRAALQSVGIYVFKDAFRDDSFSGFCLYDDQFPLIYANSSTAKTRQCFTLFHELAHLIFHTSGIDGLNEDFVSRLPDNSRKIEVICNRFAAEFLVPEAEFNASFSNMAPTEQSAAQLAREFNVSRELIYRKFLDRDLISPFDYRSAANKWIAEASSGGSGGDYYYNVISYRGRPYVELVLSHYYQNRINDIEAADYLDVRPKSLGTLESYFLKDAAG